MANRYMMIAALENGINKPGTLGKHRLEFDSQKMRVRGVYLRTPQFVEDHFNGLVPLDVEVHNGMCGHWSPSVEEITPWISVSRGDIIKYNCGRISILHGKYADIQKDLLLGKEGAKERLYAYIVNKAARKSGNYMLYKKLVEHASLKYGWLPTMEFVKELPKEYDGIIEDPNYHGYRSTAKGSECYHINICGYEVAYEATYHTDPYNIALGSIRTSMHYYVKKVR